MNAERLLAHYERIADAPDAIPRLRRFILDLAVRGKLVPQDPNDEPASELLKRIAKEKARLAKAGEIKRETPTERADADDLGLDPPAGWSVACLSDIAVCMDYRRIPINGTEREARIAGKSQKALFPYYGATQQQGWIDDYLFDGEFILLGEDGVPFHDPLRTKAYLITGKSWVNNHAHVFQAILTSPRLLVHYLNVFDYAGRVVGATRAKLNQAQAVTIPFPIPPLAEQHRIVAKVDELMALCDRLEAARAEREATRDRLTAASLARLDAPDPDPATFADHARFALDNLAALTTRPDQIKQLRRTILNLAVRGKLVPQDPNDEPASELLTSARHSKQLLRKQRGISREEDPEFSDSAGELGSPAHWEWAHLSDFALVLGGKRLPAGASFSEEPTKHIYIRVTDMKDGTISNEGIKYISPEEQRHISKYTIDQDDIYITIAGTIGEVGQVPPMFHGQNLTENAAKIVFRGVDRDFLILALRANDVQNQFSEKTKQMAQPKLALKRILGARVPVPPLAEQHRIVAKVHELMALCDRLEASLATAADTRRRLLDALLAEALAPAAARNREAAE